MDALIASAGPMSSSSRKAGPSRPRRPNSTHKTVDRGPDKESIDPSTHSILNRTRLPSSFHHSSLPTGGDSAPIRPDASVARIADKKLRAKIARQDVGSKRARMERDDVNEWLNTAVSGGAGGIEVDEEEGERTWRIDQKDIVKEVGRGAGAKRFDLKFDNMGSYKVDYTRNGRHIAIASSLGHVATFDWQAGKLLSEIQLKETVRDIKFLQSESFYAVAQKKYVFMYDQDGVELHKLKQHIDVTHLQFLPYHYLLASIGHAGYLKYHDISTGVLLTQIPTHLGSPSSFAQNPHSAILHAGHQNGTMTLWSPNLTTPHVKLLAHRGPVTGIAIDPSEHSAGRYVSTAGLDGLVKLWDGRMWGKEVRSWGVRNTPSSMSYSQRGMLAVGGKSGVTIYRGLHSSSEGKKAPTPYLTLPLPGLTPSNISFCPYDDVLGVGHGKGVSSLLVPGSGEPNFDSAEQDVYETKTRRREREVRGVMDKIRPELITLDTEFLGKVDTEQPKGTYAERESRSFRQMNRLERLQAEGKAEDTDAAHARAEEEEDGDEVKEEVKVKERYKARGKSGSMKKYLKKKKKNVIDPSLLAMRQKVASQKKADDERKKIANGELVKETGALARFG